MSFLFDFKKFKKKEFWVRFLKSLDFGWKLKEKALYLYLGIAYPIRAKMRLEIGLPSKE